MQISRDGVLRMICFNFKLNINSSNRFVKIFRVQSPSEMYLTTCLQNFVVVVLPSALSFDNVEHRCIPHNLTQKRLFTISVRNVQKIQIQHSRRRNLEKFVRAGNKATNICTESSKSGSFVKAQENDPFFFWYLDISQPMLKRIEGQLILNCVQQFGCQGSLMKSGKTS